MLNRPSSVNDNAINRLPQIEYNVLLDEFPTVTETMKAIQPLSSGKAPGTDAIPSEVYKAGGLPMAEKLTELFQCMWRKEAIPQDFKDDSIIHLYKRKGNPQVFDNHRGISLLSIAGKILAKILLNRLNACTAKMDWPWHRMPDERLPKKVLYGELHEGKRSQGGQKKRYKDTPLKPRLRISISQLSPGNRLLRIEQSGVASSTKVSPNLKQRESVKLKGSVKKGKQEPRDHRQTQHSPNSLALFPTHSLELKLAYTAIDEHTNTHKCLIFSIKMVFLSNERRTISLTICNFLVFPILVLRAGFWF